MAEDAGRGAPGGEPGLSLGAGEEAQGSDAAGAVTAGGVVRGRGRSRTAVLIIINTGAPGTRGVQDGRADERQGGLQQGKTRGVGKGWRW